MRGLKVGDVIEYVPVEKLNQPMAGAIGIVIKAGSRKYPEFPNLDLEVRWVSTPYRLYSEIDWTSIPSTECRKIGHIENNSD